ncbi:MAG: ABC transporter substrate-binding protein [Alphaproteobacteria bacterium]|nr:ABC transporter substrate-binding protein [Alphaproteobacteria bacterium]
MKIGLVSVAVLAAMTAIPASAATLRWASQGDALTMDPHSQNEGPTTTANIQVYEPLIHRNVKLELEPGLALSWKPVDPTTWEFKLRPGVAFHDGSSFTAVDAAFSIDRARMSSSDFKNYITSVKEARVIDPLTLHVITDGPNPILPNQIASILVMSKSWSEKNGVSKPQSFKDKEETYAVRNTNGTGPFITKLREPGTKTVSAKNPNWWGLKDRPHNIDEIVYTPIANAATRVSALLSGQLDFVLDVPLQDLGRLEKTPGLKVQTLHQVRTIFYGMDVGSPELKYSTVKGKNPFADARVREAIYRAVDIEAIKAKVMRGMAVPAGMITSPGVHGYSPELDKRPPFDVGKAKELMKAAGYGEGFGVTLDCPNDRYNNDEAICQATVAMLAQIGIKVDLASRSKSLHFPKLQNKDTSFYLLGWGVPTLDSHYVFSYLAQTADGKNGSWNFTQWSNKEFDALANGMLTELDASKRDAMIRKAWDMLNKEMIYLPLHHQILGWATTDKLDLPIVANDTPQFRWGRFK